MHKGSHQTDTTGNTMMAMVGCESGHTYLANVGNMDHRQNVLAVAARGRNSKRSILTEPCLLEFAMQHHTKREKTNQAPGVV